MDHSAFEKIVSDHSDLNLLINEQKFGPLCNIKKTKEMTPEFIDWISPKYYDSFVAIYERLIKTKQGVIAAVMRVQFLANDETKDRMVEFMSERIAKTMELTDKLEAHVSVNKFKAEPALKLVGSIMSPLNIAIFKHLEAPSMAEKKKVFADKMLDIADQMKEYSARRHPEQFMVYEALTNQLGQIALRGNASERVAEHGKNQSSKSNTAIAISVIVIILIIIRWVIRLSQ